VGNESRISETLVDKWGMNLVYRRGSTEQVGNGIQLNSGKGKEFLFALLSRLSYKALKRRYSSNGKGNE